MYEWSKVMNEYIESADQQYHSSFISCLREKNTEEYLVLLYDLEVNMIKVFYSHLTATKIMWPNLEELNSWTALIF